MGRRIVLSIGSLAAVLLAVFVLSMRMKARPVQDRLRRFARDVGNPRVMETAGQPGADASIVRHTGRTSGTPYETPVVAVETGEGFAIALPYGTTTDWMKNVMTAGSAEIVHEGNRYEVEHPQHVSAEVGNPYFPMTTQLSHRLFGVDDFLLLRRAESAQVE